MATLTGHSFFDEALLIKGLQNDDKAAFEAIFHRFKKPLKAFALQELRSESLADDALQEIFVKLWVKRKSIDQEQSLRGFLFTCMKNHILNAIRSKKNEILKNSRFASEHSHTSNCTEHDVRSAELENGITELIQKLPELKRKILHLNIYSGWSKEQIAQELNISPTTVKIYLSQSSRQLRSLIEDQRTYVLLLLACSF